MIPRSSLHLPAVVRTLVFACAAALVPDVAHAQQKWTLTSAYTRLTFVADPVVGVCLAEIGERTGNAANESPPSFRNDPPSTAVAGLWEIHGTWQNPPGTPSRVCEQIGPDQYCVKPNGRPFTIDTSVSGELTFLWPSVPIPDAPAGEKELRVEVRVRLDPEDRVARWWPTVQRVNGSSTSASIDEMRCPIVYVAPPIAHRLAIPVAGGGTRPETEQEAQARARVLVPINNINNGFRGTSATPAALLSSNLPMDYWFRSHGGQLLQLDHPNPGQLLQFAAVYDADPQDPGFRSMLYLGSEDKDGYAKRFCYRAVSFATGIYPIEPSANPIPLVAWRWQWYHVYLPPFEDASIAPGVTNEWGNTFVAAYPVVTGALHARSDEFWYDAAEFYRDFVKSSGMVGATFEHNALVSDAFRNQSVFSAHTLIDHTTRTTGILPRALSIALAYRAYLNTYFPSTTSTSHFLWFGNYRSDFAYGYPDFPVGVPANKIRSELQKRMDPMLPAVVQAAHALGLHTSGYTEGLGATVASAWPVPPNAWLFDRAGNRVNSTTYFVDFGDFDCTTPGITTWFSRGVGAAGSGLNGMGRLVAEAAGFRGLYVDGVSGTGFTLGYPDPANRGALGHIPHGGTYSTCGRNKVLHDVRTMLRSLPQNQGNDENTYVMSEATQEYASDLDLVMQGLDYVPYHMEQFEPEWFANPLAAVGDLEQHMTGVPLASRAWSLPLWNLVYHEYQPANTLVMAITNAGIAGGPLYPSGQGACFRPGVTPQEWEDLLCFAYAAFWIAGQKPMIVPYVHDFDFSPVSYSNGALQWDDPTGTGHRILDFIGRMHALYLDPELQQFIPAWAGRFSLFGEALRPLRTPETNPTQSNPSFPAFWNTQASLPASCSGQIAQHTSVVLPYIEQAVNVHAVLAHYLDHPVPAVLHSVWRHDGGGNGPIIPGPGQPPHLGILLANWTDAPQLWQAVLDPALYGIAPGTRYTVREVDAFGNSLGFIGSAVAPASLSISITVPARNSAINRRAVTVLTVGP